jgi:uncharacterized protein (DUF952 family)
VTDELWHLAERPEWEAARTTGSYEWSTRGRSLAEEGFIHCSRPDQLLAVSDALYGDADADDLLLLHIDPAAVPAEIRVEDGFPHIYGPLPVTAVTAVTAVRRNVEGHLEF